MYKLQRGSMANAAYLVVCLLFALLVSLLPACNNSPAGAAKEGNTAAVSIPKDTMIRILIDMHIAEAMIQSVRRDRDTTVKATIQDYYNTIYQTHHVTEQQFKEAFAYYSQDIETLDKMYDDMQTLLSKMEEQAKVK